MPSGPLLRSENLNRFRALGTQGSPVFASAAQLRSAITRQMGAEVADILAIPQINEAGDRVDWYAPHPGPVIPWSAAAPDEQQQARAAIETLRQRLKDHSTTLLAQLSESKGSHTNAAETFARLLPLAGIAPDDSHVYLVGGRPVVTFWGFEPLNAPTNWDALGNLPLTTAPSTTAAVPVAVATPWWRWLLWLLLLLLLLGLLLFGLRFCGLVSVPLPDALAPYVPPESSALPAVEPPHADKPRNPTFGYAVVVPGTTVPGVRLPDGTIVPEGTVLPDGTVATPEPSVPPGTDTDPKAGNETNTEPNRPDNVTDKNDPSLPPPTPETDNKDPTNSGKQETTENRNKTPLVIPPDAANGNTDFLNGRWNSQSGLVDAATGKPLEMQYDFKDGKGEVHLRRQDGTVCSGSVTPSLNNGALVIDQSQPIRCPDGKTYQPSQVQCRNAAGGKAACKGSYADGTGYSVTITQ